MIDILRIIGGKETVVCTVPDDNASVVGEIMGREEVNASVTVDSPLGIRVGDFVRVDGTAYTLNREAGMEKRSDVEYRYDLVFESPLYRLLDKLFTHPVTGVSTFTVSRTLKEFVKIVVDCINTIDPGWTVAANVPDTDPRNITFEGVSCRESLTRLSEGFGMDFTLSGREIRFASQIENATGLVFEQGRGKGLYTVTQEPVDTGNTITRVYPYGGTTNMMPGTGDVNGRLFLPEKYLENLTEYGKVVERVVAFDDIFPCFKGVVKAVSGEFNRVITCPEIGFNITDWLIGGVTAKINFLSGDLMGESFEFNWDNSKKQIDLVRREDGTALPDKDGKRPLIPHDQKKASSGNTFNLTDIHMPETYKTAAIGRLRERAADYLAYYSRLRVKFTLDVDHRYLRCKRVLRAGDTVTVRIPETGVDKLLRINSVERNLKTGRMSCSVSNYLDEKWEKRIEGELVSMRSSVSSDISEVRDKVSNVSRPSSLWFLDKQSEYLHLNDDGTITMLETGVEVRGNIKATGSITAYATSEWDVKGPIAGTFDPATGQGGGIGFSKYDSTYFTVDPLTGLVSIKKDMIGGLDEKALALYLSTNHYVTSSALDGLIKLSSPLTGYAKPATYTAITSADTILSAFGKLDRRFDGYVDTTTNQTIGGVKTFGETIFTEKNIRAKGSITAYATGGGDITGPIAGTFDPATNTGGGIGMSKYDSTTFMVDPLTGLVRLKGDIGGGIGGITISGTGNAISDVTLSADKKSLAFTKGLTFWHAGNDGAGSGLDADLLDGKHAASFTSFSSDGRDLDSGIPEYIHQADSTGNVNYPSLLIGGNTFMIFSVLPSATPNVVYGSQLAFGFGSDYLAIRRKQNSATWGAWSKISAGKADIAYKLGTVDVGSASLPMYLRYGAPTVCSNILDVSITGNSATATKLQTARTINGTAFDGTSNITTNTWGTARPFSIASSDFTGEGATVSVNGFSNYVLPLPSTIKATLQGNATSASTAAKLTTARKLWGQTFDGTGDVNGSLYNVNNIYMGNGNAILFSDTAGVNVTALEYNANNVLTLGYGSSGKGYNTVINGNNIYFAYGTGHSTGIYLGSNGFVGINNTAPGYRLDVGGNIKATSVIVTDEWFQNRTAGKGLQNLANGAQWYANANGWNANKSIISTGSITARATGGGDITGPIANTNVLGMVKVGTGLSIDPLTGILTSTGSGGTIGDIGFTGTGNVVTGVTLSADKSILTFAKGMTAMTEATLATYLTANSYAKTSSNVASATKLLYARTIWGQSFDGTGNITGNLVSTGDVRGNTLTSTVANGTRPLNITSSTLCPNLNANYLQGYAAFDLAQHKSYNTTASNSGYYKIKINSIDGWMLAFTVRVYQNYKYYDIVFSGYNYGTNYWFSPKAVMTGCSVSEGMTVHFGYDSVWNLWVAIPANLYTGIEICNVANGYQPINDWKNLFTITNQPSLTGTIQSTQAIYTSSYKLNTARTIWGNSFDGTADINGHLVAPSARIGMINLQGNNEINCETDMYLNYRNGHNIITNVGGGSFHVRGGGLIIDQQNANSGSHIRLINNRVSRQWGIKAGNYMFSEDDFSITNESDTTVPNLILKAGGNLENPRGSIYAGNGLVYSVYNGITSSFGAQNPTYCHFMTSAGAFYFNKEIQIDGKLLPYGGNHAIGAALTPFGEIYSNAWIRSTSDTGWYNQKWAGGIYMYGPNWIDMYNKPLRSTNFHFLGANGFGVNAQFGAFGSANSGIEIAASDNVFGIGVHADDTVYFWGGIACSQDSTAGKAYLGTINLVNNSFNWFGSILATGSLTGRATSISDMRKKNYRRAFDLDLHELLRVKTFYYDLKDDPFHREDVGFSAQQMLGIMPYFVVDVKDDNFDGGFFHTYDYGKTGAVVAIRLTQHVLPWMDRADKWMSDKDKEIIKLRKEVRELRQEVAQLRMRA